jgi:hypothetical protein
MSTDYRAIYSRVMCWDAHRRRLLDLAQNTIANNPIVVPPTVITVTAAVDAVPFELFEGPPGWVIMGATLTTACVVTHCWQPVVNYLKGNNIPHDASDPNGAKAPGKPGEREGFKDPKTGPKWGKAPNGKSGWVDAQGNVWVPTGQGALAHGGPHWDVQNADGTFGGSKYPGGFSR